LGIKSKPTATTSENLELLEMQQQPVPTVVSCLLLLLLKRLQDEIQHTEERTPLCVPLDPISSITLVLFHTYKIEMY
jgi:hypothetical protein